MLTNEFGGAQQRGSVTRRLTGALSGALGAARDEWGAGGGFQPPTDGAEWDTPQGNAAPVMVVDDSFFVRRVVEISMARVGVPVASFPDGLSALQALQSGEVAPPKVILLDISMPRLDGYEVARLLRSNAAFHKTSILMLSSHDGIVNKARAKLYGAADFIPKPFRSRDLVRRVCEALGLPTPDFGGQP